jgi:hypothetical protein
MYGILHPSCKAIPVGMKNWPYKRGGIYVSGEFSSISVSQQGRIQGGRTRRAPPPLKLEKIRFFGVKSWFFTRNTPKFFAPPSARRKFFMCAPPNLKSWIRPCSVHLKSGLIKGMSFWWNGLKIRGLLLFCWCFNGTFNNIYPFGIFNFS